MIEVETDQETGTMNPISRERRNRFDEPRGEQRFGEVVSFRTTGQPRREMISMFTGTEHPADLMHGCRCWQRQHDHTQRHEGDSDSFIAPPTPALFREAAGPG